METNELVQQAQLLERMRLQEDTINSILDTMQKLSGMELVDYVKALNHAGHGFVKSEPITRTNSLDKGNSPKRAQGGEVYTPRKKLKGYKMEVWSHCDRKLYTVMATSTKEAIASTLDVVKRNSSSYTKELVLKWEQGEYVDPKMFSIKVASDDEPAPIHTPTEDAFRGPIF